MLTFQIERFTETKAELYPIYEQQWKELALNQDAVPLLVDWKHYATEEFYGTVLFLTARKDGKIVAYYCAHVGPHRRYCHNLFAELDFFYVIPEFRGRGIIIPLMRHVERELQRRGVGVWYTGYKTANPMGLDRILPKFGFLPSDTMMVKRLKG